MSCIKSKAELGGFLSKEIGQTDQKMFVDESDIEMTGTDRMNLMIQIDYNRAGMQLPQNE